MKRVFVCSPFRGTPEQVKRNVHVAEEACRLAVRSGYAPFAPHLLYTRFLNEEHPDERAAGIAAGLAFMPVCHELWAVVDGPAGVPTDGMGAEIETALRLGIPVRPFMFVDGALVSAFIGFEQWGVG